MEKSKKNKNKKKDADKNEESKDDNKDDKLKTCKFVKARHILCSKLSVI